MIIVFKDNQDNWHLVKALGKAGIASIAITAHCGQGEGGESVSQVPDSFLTRLCKNCQNVIETLD